MDDDADKVDDGEELRYAFANEESCISLIIRMFDEIDLAAAEGRDYMAPASYGLIELWTRVGEEDPRIAELRQTSELYAHFMDTIWRMDGLMSSYAKCDIWKLTRKLRSSAVEQVVSLQEDVSSE